MKILPTLSLLLLFACFQRSTVLNQTLELPPTPPLSSMQRWAVIRNPAARLTATPNSSATVLAIIPYAGLLRIEQLRTLLTGDWCQISYWQLNDTQVVKGWLPANSLIIFNTELAARTTSRRLQQIN